MNDDNYLEPEPMQDPEPAVAEVGGDRVAELEAEVARLKDHMLRALAETDNVRKRAAKDREDAMKFAVTGFARDLLEIADNFRRALDSVPADARVGGDELFKNLLEGIEATERSMLRSFEKHGIKKLDPMDQPFDPNFHEVMFEAPIPGKPAGTIIQVMEPGYTLNDRLLRPARVGVAAAESADSGGKTDPGGQIDTTA